MKRKRKPGGATRRGLGTIDLIDADSPVSDVDLRWALGAIAKIDGAGPSMAADFRAGLTDAVRAQWWAERQMLAEQIEQVNELAADLVLAFDVPLARAQKIAKERVVGTRRTAAIAAIRHYLALVESEADRRAQRAKEQAAEQPSALSSRERAVARERTRRERRASA